MSYHHESDSQQSRREPGADPTEAYQTTAEWEAVSEHEAWEEGAGDGSWEGSEDGGWDPRAQPDEWDDQSADEDWADERDEDWDEGDESPGAITGAKQTISVAADRITRWFSGLDKRPEYEDGFAGSDPVAELAPASAAAERTSAGRERGPASGRRAAAGRAIAANRRRSVAATREGGPGAPAFNRGSAHAARTLRGADRERDRHATAPPLPERADDEPLPELMSAPVTPRFPVAPLGYNRQAVDEQFAELDRELAQLREARAQEVQREAPMSIQEELERIGEETASILVVAHDKAHETTRLAQEQAERCISDAAANAVAITEEAKRKLRELEAETEVVRRHRERLIADVRTVSVSLVSVADQAERRFAAEPQPQPQPQPQPHDQHESAQPEPPVRAERPWEPQAETA